MGTVTITLSGVDEARLPRLVTAIKTYIQRFGSTMKVEEDFPKPKGKKG